MLLARHVEESLDYCGRHWLLTWKVLYATNFVVNRYWSIFFLSASGYVIAAFSCFVSNLGTFKIYRKAFFFQNLYRKECKKRIRLLTKFIQHLQGGYPKKAWYHIRIESRRVQSYQHMMRRWFCVEGRHRKKTRPRKGYKGTLEQKNYLQLSLRIF